VAWKWRKHIVWRPTSMADRTAAATTFHKDCWTSGGACTSHKSGSAHGPVPERLVTELHGRLPWWQPTAQTGRAMHNAIPTYARNTVHSEAPQRFLVTVVPRYSPDAGEARLETLNSSAEADTD
jgi:hypothetical protein